MDAHARSEFLEAAKRLPSEDLKRIIGEERVRRADATRMADSFYEFVKGAWHVVEPAQDYIDGEHVRAAAVHLQAVTEGLVRRLMANLPPGHAKSIIFSVMWNAWVWLKNPGWRLISISQNNRLSFRDARATRDLIQSAWYQETFRPTWGLKYDQNVKSFFMTTEGGYRLASSIGSDLTGDRCHCVLGDDLLDVEDRFNKAARDKASEYMRKKAASRLNDKRTQPIVVVGHRLHKADPYGQLCTKRWTHLNLATEYDPKRHCKTDFWEDQRTQAGELLFDALFTKDVIVEVKSSEELGLADFEAQHNQNPYQVEGSVWKRKDWCFWTANPLTKAQKESGKWIQLPDTFDITLASVDCSFGQRSKNVSNSYTVIQTWAKKAANRFMLDSDRRKMSFRDMILAINKQRTDHPETTRTYIENAGSGSDVIDWERDKIPGLIPVPARQDKYTRAHQESAVIESGNVYLPDPEAYPWVNDFIDECSNFSSPKSKPNDQVDTCSQALAQMRKAPMQLHIGSLRPKAEREASKHARAKRREERRLERAKQKREKLRNQLHP